jgi:hypothetical protein
MNGMLKIPGVIPPEQVAIREDNFNYLMNHLKERGVVYRMTRQNHAV